MRWWDNYDYADDDCFDDADDENDLAYDQFECFTQKHLVKQTVPGRSYRQIFMSGFSRRLIDPLYRPIFGLHILPTHQPILYSSHVWKFENSYLLWLIGQFWPHSYSRSTQIILGHLLGVSSKWFNCSRPVGHVGLRNATLYLLQNSCLASILSSYSLTHYPIAAWLHGLSAEGRKRQSQTGSKGRQLEDF